MKNKPGPKVKSFEERKHQVIINVTGHALKYFGSKAALRRYVESSIERYRSPTTDDANHQK